MAAARHLRSGLPLLRSHFAASESAAVAQGFEGLRVAGGVCEANTSAATCHSYRHCRFMEKQRSFHTKLVLGWWLHKAYGGAPIHQQVLMATNRIDILDQALLRHERIDGNIEFPNPNENSCFDILKIHSRKMNLMRGIDLKKIAEMMNGALGAEMKVVCTEAGMFAIRERRVHVTQEDFEMVVAKVMKKGIEKNMS